MHGVNMKKKNISVFIDRNRICNLVESFWGVISPYVICSSTKYYHIIFC